MKFKIIKTAGLPGYGPKIRLNVWEEWVDDEGLVGGYWDEIEVDFFTIESAKKYAEVYKSETYTEEFEV